MIVFAFFCWRRSTLDCQPGTACQSDSLHQFHFTAYTCAPEPVYLLLQIAANKVKQFLISKLEASSQCLSMTDFSRWCSIPQSLAVWPPVWTDENLASSLQVLQARNLYLARPALARLETHSTDQYLRNARNLLHVFCWSKVVCQAYQV